MIFVSTGSQKFQFDRLLKAVDQLLEEGSITEEVFAQTGYSTYQPVNYRYEAFLDPKAFEEAIEGADMIITHAGTGVIIKAIKKGKRVIVVPRLGAYGEHVDDHQIQIAEMFRDLGYVIACEDVSKLGEKLEKGRVMELKRYESNTQRYVEALDEYIQSL